MTTDLWLSKWTGPIAAGTHNPAILELGCGGGRDTAFLAQHAFTRLTVTDISCEALAQCARIVPSANIVCHDLRRPLPFEGDSFDVTIASLCLHYFDWDTTRAIVDEIRRCLVDEGLLLCRVNSTKDVNYGAVGHREIAPHFYDVDGRTKRFFSGEDIDALFQEGWQCLAKEEMTIDRYEKEKVVWEVALRKA